MKLYFFYLLKLSTSARLKNENRSFDINSAPEERASKYRIGCIDEFHKHSISMYIALETV